MAWIETAHPPITLAEVLRQGAWYRLPTWTGTGAFQIGESAVFNNASAFAVSNDVILRSFGSVGIINNSGTWTKTSFTGTGNTRIDPIFNNLSTGIVQVSSGSLELDQGGSNANIYNADAGATFFFDGGIYTMTTVAQLNGAGTYELDAGQLTINASVSIPGSSRISGCRPSSGGDSWVCSRSCSCAGG